MTNASEVLSSIQSAFPGAVLDSRVESDRRLWATIDSKKILDVCKHLTRKAWTLIITPVQRAWTGSPETRWRSWRSWPATEPIR